jgi:hypothetical protein
MPAQIKKLLEQADGPKADARPEKVQAPLKDDDVLAPERRSLPIPSYILSVDPVSRSLEIDQRLKQAARILGDIRDLIADKSFQFSHVIRAAPRKGVKTRARSFITKLNQRIAYQCRIYSRCRLALVKLEAGEVVLTKYQILKIEDVSSSSALIDPNRPGSTKIALSWIWQTGLNSKESSSSALRECAYRLLHEIIR